MYAVIFFAGYLFKGFEAVAVFESKTFVNAADNFTVRFGNGLICTLAVFLYTLRKISVSFKLGIVGIYKSLKGCRIFCCIVQFLIYNGLSLSLPLTAAFLEEPQADYVFEKTYLSAVAALVGYIKLRGFL